MSATKIIDRHLAALRSAARPIVPEDDIFRAFEKVRVELWEVGLLADGKYLDRIDCHRAMLPTFESHFGYVYDERTPWLHKLLGFRAGDIYVPLNAPVRPRTPGSTLLDTVRHEFGHSWAWLDRSFVDGPWFREAFGGSYDDDWGAAPDFDADDHVSPYACNVRPAEDFCETFMTFLRCRRSLHRFDARRGVRRKLRAVARAVATAAKTRVPSVRGPRR